MIYRILLFLGFILFLNSCARRGRPIGGPKDEDKPIMVKAEPEFESIQFHGDEIKIYFDEFIKLKDVTSQLIISPPLKYPPVISPMGTPSKRITIRIKDTLDENTTYTINFGQSIIDNTEGNILDNFKYVFSTGDYIDSLQVKGTIKDAFDLEMKNKPTLMLYAINENFKDSIIYQEKPMYVGSVLDSLNWEITNIKAGSYLLLALDDISKNYKFNPKEDLVGFHTEIISVPTDTTYRISLFKEILPFRIPSKPKEIEKGHIVFGYEGNPIGFTVENISVKPANYKSFITFDKEKDTLHYWFNNYDKDSILFSLSKKKAFDTLRVKLISDKIDSLKLNSLSSGTLHLRDTFKLISNIPVSKIDTNKITFIDRDSTQIVHHINLSENRDEIFFNFEKEISTKYKIELLPGAITDFNGIENDTLILDFSTRKPANYSSIYLSLHNVKSYPIIVELINDQGEVFIREFSDHDREYKFENLSPSRYKVRIIYDTNKNRRWDTGSYLSKLQPEEVYYFNEVINAKANWEVIESLTIE